MSIHNAPTDMRHWVREREVHRDIFTHPDVFALEMQTVFTHTWVYVGHASQIPQAGDYHTTTVGDQPVVMVRQADGGIAVLHNRCAHKGVKIAGREHGNTGKFFRCPYHAWTFKLDGA
ncbi:MAG: oxidoreductase, partial [Betaproteobacteria bacterium]|nr:oxidoreductase [Betaproteobacteria bacterium]